MVVLPQYVMVVLKGSVPMAFGGTQEPAAYGELVSIGGMNPDVNKKLSAGIASILESKLSVPKSRFYLKFYDSKVSSHLYLVTLCSLAVARHNKKSNTLWVTSKICYIPTTCIICIRTVFRDPLVLGAIELVVSFLCSLLVYGHDKLQFGTFGFREPKILIHVASLFNRSFLCIEAVEDDALPIRR